MTLPEARRARALAAMADADVDALVLGREANARYVAGARRLWLAGTRPFMPGCVLGRSGAVHLLNASDDGVPADIPFDHLYALTWNPANLMARLAGVPDLAAATRIGVDALTPLMESLLGATFPGAELVDGHAVMLAARRRKLPEEIDALRLATATAAAALDDVVGLVRPGVRERDLRGAFQQRMCERGTTTPAFEGTFGSVFPGARELAAGDRVVLDVGVLVDGYEGGLARTVVCGDERDAVPGPADDLFAALLAAVAPGATASDLWAVWDATGVERPTGPVAHGIGLGVEPPWFGDDPDALEEGMVMSLLAAVDGWVRRATVVVTGDGADVLGPHAEL